MVECGSRVDGFVFPTFRTNILSLSSWYEGSNTQRHGITSQKTWLHKAPLFVQERETRLGEPQPQGGELTFSARLLCAEPLIPCTVGSDEHEPRTCSNNDSPAMLLHDPDLKRLYGAEDWLRMRYEIEDRL
jgi:hypothetical protein